ncbi:MAG: hypothetical protein H8D34_02145 [Chloroflexi bacterium]|nr:hypothetical protein [Chloroflexota bacterium]
MPMTAQYFDGSNFVLNTDDNLTALATTDLILTSVAQAGETDGDIVVTTGNTSIANIANNPLLAGDAALSFCPPGSPACTPASGNSGSIDVQIDLSLLPYLKFDWLGTGDADPIARATFGIFSGNSKQIYYRQIYQQ